MRIQLKRGDTLALSSYTGPAGEIVINTDTGLPHLQDGVTPGGNSISGIRYTVTRPEIISPLQNSSNVNRTPILQSSLYMGAGGHLASYWEIATVFSMKDLVYASNKDNLALTMHNLADAGIVLQPLTSYYVRVRHESDLGFISNWSGAVKFTTAT